MTDLRTPRRRVPRAGTSSHISDVIQLPAPQQTTTSLPPRNESPTDATKVGSTRFSVQQRAHERNASAQARAAWARVAGQPVPEPVTPKRSLPQKPSLKVIAPIVRRGLKTRRRLLAHTAVLLMACLVAAGRGFPLYEPHSHEGESAQEIALEIDGAHDDDFAKVIIPITATQPNAVGGIERDEPLVDVGPALIKPAPQRGPAFVSTHVVASGETIASIAEAYNISPDSLIASNDLTSLLPIGEKLRIPRMSGVPHVVEDGETLSDIAARYGVAPEEIMTYPPNGLEHGQALVAGREIFVPNASLAGVSDVSVRGAIESINTEAQAAATVIEDRVNLRKGPSTKYDKITKVDAGTQLLLIAKHEDWVKVRQPDGGVAWIFSDVLAIPQSVWDELVETDNFPPPPPPPPVWVWPSYGDLTSGFGYRNFSVGRFHNGIDIANSRGTPISAARRGTVIEAGWCSGYGYCVKISHGSGLITEYGHMMSRPVVYDGQEVEAGQLIGYMGSTYDRSGGGYSTGVHLHFTVKVDGVAVNPLRYLP